MYFTSAWVKILFGAISHDRRIYHVDQYLMAMASGQRPITSVVYDNYYIVLSCTMK